MSDDALDELVRPWSPPFEPRLELTIDGFLEGTQSLGSFSVDATVEITVQVDYVIRQAKADGDEVEPSPTRSLLQGPARSSA